ncbi:MAG: radical SAM protein [Candidatus Aenigmarchaeota archaeon]|nr:radical SAM protein [Candidatus Aenigmarchaeota archaeon]
MRNKIEKILLIQSPNPKGKVVLRDHAGKFGIVEKKTSVVRYDKLPPLDLAYAASLLEENRFKADIIDSPTMNYNKETILKMISEKKPDLIFVNTSGSSISSDLDIANYLKNSTGIETIGLTQVYYPEKILKKTDIKFFIRGEIEYTILEFCQKYPKIKKIKGLIWKKGNKFFYNKKREFIKNLNELPFPAYHLLPMDRYSHHMFKKKNFFTVLTSRGCPFSCIYCPYPLGYGSIWRSRDPENVLEELELLTEKHNVKSILFRDQVFNLNPKRAEKICDGIIRRGIDIEWRCEARVELFSKELLKKMKVSGCKAIHLGIESGDINILKEIAKGGISKNHIQKVKEVFNHAREIGIETVAFFMVGFPNETKESVSKTFKLAKEINASEAWFCSMVPYPGTELHEIAKKEGWLLTDDIEDYTGRDVVMVTNCLTKKEIKDSVETGNALFFKDNTNFLKTVFNLKSIESALLDPKKAIKLTLGRFRKGEVK